MLRKINAMQSMVAVEDPFNDPEFLRDYPVLYHYLSQTSWDDGSRRQTATLLIFCEGSVMKMCLNDREMNRSVFVTGPTFEGMLKTLELGLADGRLDWRSKKAYSSDVNRVPF